MTQTPTSPQRIVTSEMYPPLYRAAMEIDSAPATSGSSGHYGHHGMVSGANQSHLSSFDAVGSHASFAANPVPANPVSAGPVSPRRPTSLYEATRNETVSSSPVLSSSPMFDVIDAPAPGNTPLFDDVRESVARDRIRVVPSDERANRVDTLIEPPRRDVGFATESAGYDDAPLPSRRSRDHHRQSPSSPSAHPDSWGAPTAWSAATSPPQLAVHTSPQAQGSAAGTTAQGAQSGTSGTTQVGVSTPAAPSMRSAPSGPSHPMTSGFARIADLRRGQHSSTERSFSGSTLGSGLRAHVGTGPLTRSETSSGEAQSADALVRASTPLLRGAGASSGIADSWVASPQGHAAVPLQSPAPAPTHTPAPSAPSPVPSPSVSVTCTQGIPIMGGRMGDGVVRYGDCVRHLWSDTASPAVEVLRALDAVGFPSAPRVVESRPGEWFSLTYLEGHVPDNQQWFSTAQVRQAGHLLRTFHEAMVRAFPSDGDSLVGHGDPSPMNVVFRNGRPAALIDFAQVKMVHRMDELAYAAWMWCLSSREYWPGIDEQAFNVAHMLDGYGVPSEARSGFAARMLHVQEAAGAQWGMHGSQGHTAPERSSDMVRWVTREHNYLSHHVGVFQAVLDMHVPGSP